MKRLRIVFICAGLLFLLSGCGKSKQAPVHIEPVKSAPAKTDDKTLERFPDSDPENEETQAPESESPVLQKPVIDINPIKEEEIPVLKPIKPDETDQLKHKLSGKLSSGITGIFCGFGYTGTIDVPENFKRRVAYYIRYFSEHKKGSRFFRRAMARGKKYLPMIRKVLKRKQLPLSLAYLPLIESGFNAHARSRARAVGLWQFMKGTARMYGLKVNRYIDQRRDPEKSTVAAAEYLNDLLAMFGAEDPFLGICAYNCGEGKVLRSLRKISYKERSFWTLVRKNLLPNETDQYIPRILAVVLMSNEPDHYLAASKMVPADMISEEAETEDLEVINALKSSKDNLVTNGNEESEEPESRSKIKAKSKKRSVAQNKSRLIRYRVKRGDTLFSIAKAHRVYIKGIKKWNRLRSNRIKIGQRLVIYKGKTQLASTSGSRNRKKRKAGTYKLVYTVNYTDSLARIALFFKGVSVREIMRWNRLRRSRIHPKQRLSLYLDKRPRKILTHTVRRGDTAQKIARKYKLRIEYVLSLNGLLTSSRLKPGKRLKIYYF